jgi:HD-like signal output (HDOD) protein
MKIQCRNCSKTYDIPEEHIRSYGEHVTISCTECKSSIEINLKSVDKGPESVPASQTSSESALTGEALKKQILRTLHDLPTMPEVEQKARKIVSDENSSFTDLAKVIETDQAIAARVLKLANSSYYSAMGSVTSVQHASVVLGLDTLNEILTLACASSVLGSELNGYGQASGDLWKHSLAVAGCAKIISSHKNPALADDAFSAGLIHDCGKLVLNQYIAERNDEFRKFMAKGEKTFLEAEQAIFGFDHAMIAGEICSKWKIPKKLSIAIEYHHSPSRLQVNELAYIVHTADAIAMMSGIGAGTDCMMYQVDSEASKFLEMDSSMISRFMAETVEYVEKTLTEF